MFVGDSRKFVLAKISRYTVSVFAQVKILCFVTEFHIILCRFFKRLLMLKSIASIHGTRRCGQTTLNESVAYLKDWFP